MEEETRVVWSLCGDVRGQVVVSGVLDWEAPGGRGRGHLRTRWMDWVEVDMKGRELRKGVWEDRTLNPDLGHQP